MFRSGRLLSVQLRDQSAARREAVTSHAQFTGVGRRQWTDITERSGTDAAPEYVIVIEPLRSCRARNPRFARVYQPAFTVT